MRSDNESSILALKEAMRRENAVDIALDKVPFGGHQANGLVENAIKNVQGQSRKIEHALER